MADARRAAVKRALRTNAELKRLFNSLGGTEHPRGRLMLTYRTARAALINETNPFTSRGSRHALDVLIETRRAVETITREVLQQARDLGAQQAVEDLNAYGVPAPLADAGDMALIENAKDAILSTFDVQSNTVRAQFLTDTVDDSFLFGDPSERDSQWGGFFSPGAVLRSEAHWLTFTTTAVYGNRVADGSQRTRTVFKRQAIAALDERTTQTCLMVNGQVVGLDEDFVLRGTPRYADHQLNPGFHDYCRTVTAILRTEEAGDDLTKEMQSAADDELKAREDGSRKEIHPAHSTSRRQGS